MNDEPKKFARWRKDMVERQIIARGVNDPLVIDAMMNVPRHLFVSEALVDSAYGDFPLPIGEGQTISQPYIVAVMTELLELKPDDRVLEIGTGSGYAAAILSRIAKVVYTIERHTSLADSARRVFDRLGYDNIRLRQGDGSLGWPEAAPFDAIVVTAAAGRIPRALKDQLALGGRLVIPVGPPDVQELLRMRRTDGDRYEQETLLAVRFVPLISAEAFS